MVGAVRDPKQMPTAYVKTANKRSTKKIMDDGWHEFESCLLMAYIVLSFLSCLVLTCVIIVLSCLVLFCIVFGRAFPGGV